jgi:SAM-dependent methyltransferase
LDVRIPAMPYFDFVLARLAQDAAGGGDDPDPIGRGRADAGADAVARAWSRHMHLGYWDPAVAPDLSAAGHQRAMDDLTRTHFDHAGIAPGQTVVDVGCGLGGTIAILNDSFDGLRLAGVNVDPRQLAHARARVLPRPRSGNAIDFIEADACALPFADGSVDVVLSVECIFHFSSKRRYFREVRRVLKDGGRLVFSDLVARPATAPLLLVLYLALRAGVRGTYGDCAPPVSRGVYRRLAARTGFEVLGVRDVTRGTLPNYPLFRQLMTDFAEAETFRRGVRFLEYASRSGLYTYDVFSLRASRARSRA